MTSTEKERADYNIDHSGLKTAADVLHEVAQMIRPPRDEGPGPFDDERTDGELPARSVIEAGSTEIQYRYAKECIGIAVVELNRAYAEFDIDGNGNIISLPTGRIQEADRLLSTARKHLDIHLDDLDEIPF